MWTMPWSNPWRAYDVACSINWLMMAHKQLWDFVIELWKQNRNFSTTIDCWLSGLPIALRELLMKVQSIPRWAPKLNSSPVNPIISEAVNIFTRRNKTPLYHRSVRASVSRVIDHVRSSRAQFMCINKTFYLETPEMLEARVTWCIVCQKRRAL